MREGWEETDGAAAGFVEIVSREGALPQKRDQVLVDRRSDCFEEVEGE
jgi:hypothetical protein